MVVKDTGFVSRVLGLSSSFFLKDYGLPCQGLASVTAMVAVVSERFDAV